MSLGWLFFGPSDENLNEKPEQSWPFTKFGGEHFLERIH